MDSKCRYRVFEGAGYFLCSHREEEYSSAGIECDRCRATGGEAVTVEEWQALSDEDRKKYGGIIEQALKTRGKG